jgi:hypothetical protein
VSRWEGSLSALRAAIIAALRDRASLADSVDDSPPDTMALESDAQLAGRVYVGLTSITARDPHGRRVPPAEAVLGTITATVRAYLRRQPSDRTRVSGDGIAHSYDEALDLGELLVGSLLYATPLNGYTLIVLQTEALWRVEVTAQAEWAPAPLGAP